MNDNRIFLLSLLDELQADLHEANVEIASLKERLDGQTQDSKPPASNGDAPSV